MERNELIKILEDNHDEIKQFLQKILVEIEVEKALSIYELRENAKQKRELNK